MVAPLSGTTATKRRSDCLAPTCTAWRSTPVTTGSTGHPPRPVPLRRDLPDQGRPGDRPDGIHHRRAEPLLRLRTPRRRHRPAESGGPDREHRPRSDLETSCPRGVSPTSTRSLPPTGVLGNDGTCWPARMVDSGPTCSSRSRRRRWPPRPTVEPSSQPLMPACSGPPMRHRPGPHHPERHH